MKILGLTSLILTLLLMIPVNEALSATISMNTLADQTETSLYETVNEFFITPYGTISFSDGRIYSEPDNLWFRHDGAWNESDYAVFTFDFDVDVISFTAWGAVGGIYAVAYDINNNEVDSYYTLDEIYDHPVSLSGSGIRKLIFADGRLVSLGAGGNIEIVDVLITTSAPILPECRRPCPNKKCFDNNFSSNTP